MQLHSVELNNVIYNAAKQQFEALATIHDPAGTRRYPCAINAPIDMSFERAASGLRQKALRQHARRTSGSFLRAPRADTRTLTRRRVTESIFYPLRWFQHAA